MGVSNIVPVQCSLIFLCSWPQALQANGIEVVMTPEVDIGRRNYGKKEEFPIDSCDEMCFEHGEARNGVAIRQAAKVFVRTIVASAEETRKCGHKYWLYLSPLLDQASEPDLVNSLIADIVGLAKGSFNSLPGDH